MTIKSRPRRRTGSRSIIRLTAVGSILAVTLPTVAQRQTEKLGRGFITVNAANGLLTQRWVFDSKDKDRAAITSRRIRDISWGRE